MGRRHVKKLSVRETSVSGLEEKSELCERSRVGQHDSFSEVDSNDSITHYESILTIRLRFFQSAIPTILLNRQRVHDSS
ncbi:hypothetical protein ANN_14988 [Periplaneta americana]|uniref:Uncharacterized protein n=1 Tax=Periplaneta americana TaxID=6978 RepID=A0ABQ8SXU0_PERAM|nr:hypothetical protein ANN_14988 [Periplaneta americana]